MSPELISSLALIILAVLFWPGVGLVPRWLRAREFAHRSRLEDALKHLLKAEVSGLPVSPEALAGRLQVSPGSVLRLLSELEEKGLLTLANGKPRLRSSGREIGLHIVRAHRLWESYLADSTGVEESEWHRQAEKQEHLLSPQAANDLAARLGHPTHDPHGDCIPANGVPLQAEQGVTLNEATPESPLVITHIEDEPEIIYRQLLALGLRPGMKAFVLEKTPRRIRFWADGTEHVLAPLLAENVSIRSLPEGPAMREWVEERYLSMIKPGEIIKVAGLSPACRPAERRRLLDLGFVPGTPVEIEMVSPAGDPTAYKVRGTIVALRREQAQLIRVTRTEAVAA